MADETSEIVVTPAADSLEAAADAYLKTTGQDEAKKDDAEEVPAPAEPVDETESEGQSQDDASDDKPDDQPETAEVEIEGKTYEIPKELKDGYLRQADYSRKMGEVTSKAKSVEVQLEASKALIENAEKLGEIRGELTIIDHRLKQYEGMDWPQLRRDDPQAYTLQMLDYRVLAEDKEKAIAKGRTLQGDIEQKSRDVFSARIAEREKECAKAIPGYNKVAPEIGKYAIENGYSVEDLSNNTLADARVVIALNKARLYDELVKSKDAVIAKAQKAPPVAKPGVPRSSSALVSEKMGVLRKTNTADAAADVYLAMHRQK